MKILRSDKPEIFFRFNTVRKTGVTLEFASVLNEKFNKDKAYILSPITLLITYIYVDAEGNEMFDGIVLNADATYRKGSYLEDNLCSMFEQSDIKVTFYKEPEDNHLLEDNHFIFKGIE